MVAYLIGAPFKLNREQVSLLEVDRFVSKYAILFMLVHWAAIYQVIAITINDSNPLVLHVVLHTNVDAVGTLVVCHVIAGREVPTPFSVRRRHHFITNYSGVVMITIFDRLRLPVPQFNGDLKIRHDLDLPRIALHIPILYKAFFKGNNFDLRELISDDFTLVVRYSCEPGQKMVY